MPAILSRRGSPLVSLGVGEEAGGEDSAEPGDGVAGIVPDGAEGAAEDGPCALGFADGEAPPPDPQPDKTAIAAAAINR